MKGLVALAAVVSLAVAGCSTSSTGSPSGSPTSASAASGAGLVNVVASTNVYGDIVKTIGGPAVAVTSIIDSPDRDPHEYEADARTQLALSKAQLVIENGGGYDDFVDTMLKSAQTKPTVINVAMTSSGLNQHPADGEFNEHLWYDFPTVEKLAAQLVTDLSAAAPGQAATFNSNAKAFTAQLGQLQQDEAAIKAKHAGERCGDHRSRCRCTCWRRPDWSTRPRRSSARPSSKTPTYRRRC